MTSLVSNFTVSLQVAPFMRSGSVGDWQKHFTQEESQYVDMKVKEVLEPAGLTFTYTL